MGLAETARLGLMAPTGSDLGRDVGAFGISANRHKSRGLITLGT